MGSRKLIMKLINGCKKHESAEMDSAVVPWPWPSKAKISNPGAVEVITVVELVITVQRRTESASRGNFVTMMRSLQERHNVTPGMSGFKFPFKCPEKYKSTWTSLKTRPMGWILQRWGSAPPALSPYRNLHIFRPISRFSRQFHGFSLAGQCSENHFPWNLNNFFSFREIWANFLSFQMRR